MAQFSVAPDDGRIRWTWPTGFFEINQRYYLTAMAKDKVKKLDTQMKKLNAKMEVRTNEQPTN
jgi:hypothetical protein